MIKARDTSNIGLHVPVIDMLIFDIVTYEFREMPISVIRSHIRLDNIKNESRKIDVNHDIDCKKGVLVMARDDEIFYHMNLVYPVSDANL